MVNLDWCKKQSRGIRLVEPNDNLANEYLKNVEETLEVLKEIGNKSNMWLATTKYYFEYFCVYSILMKIGIKCEIHDCTIEVCKILEEQEVVPNGFSQVLERDKELRIDNQYYLKNKKVDIDYDELTNFYLEIKDILSKMTSEKINLIRKLI